MAAKRRTDSTDLLDQAYEYEEASIARHIGLSRNILKMARDGISDDLWRIESGAVCYTRSGAECVLQRAGLSRALADEAIEKSRITREWRSGRAGIRLAVVTVMPPNRTMVMARLCDDPDNLVVRVIVGDQTLFSRGMEISVRTMQEPDLFELAETVRRSR